MVECFPGMQEALHSMPLLGSYFSEFQDIIVVACGKVKLPIYGLEAKEEEEGVVGGPQSSSVLCPK